MTDHLSFDTLCDLADGAASAELTASVRSHLATCAECAGELASVTALSATAAAMPREIAPPSELWPSIRAELAPRSLARTPSARSSGRSGARWQLAAAALFIAAVSSALTALAVRSRGADGVASSGAAASDASATRRPGLPSRQASSPLPAHLASTELSYTRSAEQLRRALDERRDSLAPSTVATVEQSLRVADSAIAEARAALARDPGNGVLAALFASNHERKIDLLRRASELAPRT